MSVKDLSTPTRRSIFEAMVAMAWADTRLEREEIYAVQAAGRVLGLPDDAVDALDAGPPPITKAGFEGLSAAERQLVYVCAAWLACVDAQESPDENQLLEELRQQLEIPAKTATDLRDGARVQHATTPPSVPWWQELDQLIGRLRPA